MKEVLVTFETAKLAKEKGFNWECYNVFPIREISKPFRLDYYEGDGTGLIKNSEVTNTSTGEVYICTAPTQSLLQKWLREIHDIHININTYYFENLKKYGYEVEDIIYPEGWVVFTNPKISYEEALEFGLQQALKLIEV